MIARLKKNDVVVVISGKYKGQQGPIIEIDTKNDFVKVRGVAIKTCHRKAKSNKEVGKIVQEESYMPACKVMPLCPETKKPCRVRVKLNDQGERVRMSHRAQIEL
jgi:large subunit ribosomal protein L24